MSNKLAYIRHIFKTNCGVLSPKPQTIHKHIMGCLWSYYELLRRIWGTSVKWRTTATDNMVKSIYCNTLYDPEENREDTWTEKMFT